MGRDGDQFFASDDASAFSVDVFWERRWVFDCAVECCGIEGRRRAGERTNKAEKKDGEKQERKIKDEDEKKSEEEKRRRKAKKKRKRKNGSKTATTVRVQRMSA